MSSKLKAITTKAKQLYKTGKFSKWTDAIKEASKSLVKKTGSKKIGAIKKKATKKVVKKKIATKKKAVKKSPVRNYGSHKDTASHNVRISVVSGIKKDALKEIELTKKIILDQSELLERLQKSYKFSKSKLNKELLMMDIKTLKQNFIPHNKKYLKSLQIAFKKSI
jgi:hypothetical protein